MKFRDGKRHIYYWFIRCPSCQKDYSFRTVIRSHTFVPIPVLARNLGYQGKCRRCRIKSVKDILTKWKETKNKMADETNPKGDETL